MATSWAARDRATVSSREPVVKRGAKRVAWLLAHLGSGSALAVRLGVRVGVLARLLIRRRRDLDEHLLAAADRRRRALRVQDEGGVVARPAAEEIGLAVRSERMEHVVARTSVQPVRSPASVQRVVPAAAAHGVVTAVTGEPIIAVAAGESIVVGAAIDAVVPVSARRQVV